MKVLQISAQVYAVPPPGYGGLELVVHDLSVELAKMGHEVYVLAPAGSGGDQYGYKVITPTAGGLLNPEDQAWKAIRPALKDFDLVHEHSWSGFAYMAAREDPRTPPIVQTLHGPLQYGSKPVPEPNFICASQAHADFVKRAAGFEARVVYHGIDLSHYPFPEVAHADFLLHLARIGPEKGPLEFVALCKQVGMRGIVAGDDKFPPDTGYIWRVMEACAATNGQVRYMGPIPHEYKLELLQQAACLVTALQPPYIEVFGLATVEALACGTPVLSTDRGAAREIILEGKTGAVVKDTSQLARGLAVALQCGPEACRARAEEFGRERMAKAYLSLYDKVLGGERW